MKNSVIEQSIFLDLTNFYLNFSRIVKTKAPKFQEYKKISLSNETS